MPNIRLGSQIDLESLKRGLPADISVQETGEKCFRFDASGSSLDIFILTWAASIAAQIVANAIYDAIKNSTKKNTKHITIDDVQVEFTRGEITKYIHKHIEHHESSGGD